MVRFRRMDELNFVIERLMEPKGDRKDGSKEWRVLGHYGTIEAMLKDAVNMGAYGDDAKTLAKALQTTTSTLLAAFHEAVETGALVYDPEPAREKGRLAAEAKKKKGAA